MFNIKDKVSYTNEFIRDTIKYYGTSSWAYHQTTKNGKRKIFEIEAVYKSDGVKDSFGDIIPNQYKLKDVDLVVYENLLEFADV